MSDFWKPPFIPGELPRSYREVKPPFPCPEGAQRVFIRQPGPLLVMIDCTEKGDGKFWTHISMSYADSLPSYHDMVSVKRLFLPGRKAIQVFPKESEHVSIHDHCLHLWSCEQDELPDFTMGTGMI
jgi:hypothetical protein